MSGPWAGRPTWPRRLTAGAVAQTLRAFVVPGTEVAGAVGLDVAGAGLGPVATPRHADVLVLVGALPDGLARTAAVVYAQMPRPRAILAVGSREAPPLPSPDVAVAPAQEALSAGVTRLRERFAGGAWIPPPPAFTAVAVAAEPPAAEGVPGVDHAAGAHHHGAAAAATDHDAMAASQAVPGPTGPRSHLHEDQATTDHAAHGWPPPGPDGHGDRHQGRHARAAAPPERQTQRTRRWPPRAAERRPRIMGTTRSARPRRPRRIVSTPVSRRTTTAVTP